jgi:hypothetical protein
VELAVALGTGVALRPTVAANRQSSCCGVDYRTASRPYLDAPFGADLATAREFAEQFGGAFYKTDWRLS